MNQEFREGVTTRANTALTNVDQILTGNLKDNVIISAILKIVGFGIKIEHIQQVEDYRRKSLAIRILPFLKSEKVREKYIKITHPELRPLLQDRPKKGGK
jgi:hypothetical protein